MMKQDLSRNNCAVHSRSELKRLSRTSWTGSTLANTMRRCQRVGLEKRLFSGKSLLDFWGVTGVNNRTTKQCAPYQLHDLRTFRGSITLNR